ncbi:MAG: AAA family ATPase, partial [Deltaproteobacteria bacterium]|nr:AAA family ATPase [Deltaproteobacteria bacterium]
VDFHRQATSDDETTANGAPNAVWRILTDNYTNVARFRGVTIETQDDEGIQSFSRAFLDRNQPLLRRRQSERRIRECHGDLHTDHIYFTQPLVIVDCIEFNRQFRYCDTASDLAFLAMDIDFHGRPDLSRYVVDRYVALSNDIELRRLLPFYQCYRAYVRGKVDSLRSVEPEIEASERTLAAASARKHFDLAYRYTWTARPALILVAGLSGSGKSVIAGTMRQRIGFRVLSSDAVRKELAALAPSTQARDYDAGLYTPAHTKRTYDTLFERAEQELKLGNGVILDATFQRRSDRNTARSLSQRAGVPLLLVECRATEAVTRRRLDARAARGNSVSDADWQIFLEQRKRFETIADDESADGMVIDTDADAEQLARRILAVLQIRVDSL